MSRDLFCLTGRAGKQAWLSPYWMDDLGLH